METLETAFESRLKSRIEDHLKKHSSVSTLECTQLVTRVVKCANCGKDVKRFSFVFACEETTEDGGKQTMLFCTESEHDTYVVSGRPFEYDVAIDIARELGAKAGMIAFANWLFAEIEANSKINISPYINIGSDDIELGELPETLQGWEKQYLEEQFEFCKQETYNRLYESMVPKN